MAQLKQTCLVSLQRSSENTSCSGIIINHQHGYIISHATLIFPLLTQNQNLLAKLEKSGYLDRKHFKAKKVDALLEYDKPVKSVQYGLARYVTALLNFNSRTSAKFDAHTSTVETEIMHVWKVDKFANILQSLFPKSDRWTFTDTSKADKPKSPTKTPVGDIDPEKVAFLLPYFVLLKTKHPLDSTSHLTLLNLVSSQSTSEGDFVLASGTPFGNLSPPVFLNSTSKGVICKTTGKDKCLILTDARCIPGCEGGALYRDSAMSQRYQHLIPKPCID